MLKSEIKNFVTCFLQVYIFLITDGNTAHDGFNLTYSIHKCPMNCSNNATHTLGTCQSDGKCHCTGTAFGDHCQFQMCPKVCFQGGGNGICNMVGFLFWNIKRSVKNKLFYELSSLKVLADLSLWIFNFLYTFLRKPSTSTLVLISPISFVLARRK